MSSITNICVTPKSAIASLGVMVHVSWGHDCFVGTFVVNAVWYSMFVLSETLDVTIVMLSSLMVVYLSALNVILGSNAVIITENGLHLQATSLPIAPKRHNCGKTILWQFLVQHLYPALMYCWAL